MAHIFTIIYCSVVRACSLGRCLTTRRSINLQPRQCCSVTLVYRVSHCLDLQFAYDGNAIYICILDVRSLAIASRASQFPSGALSCRVNV